MNELQIRLSADIKQLQTALSRAKKTIKLFESETEKGSERSNVGFKRMIGLIEQLENKAKKLRVALRQATSEEHVERYNRELVQTTAEMTRLNSLGRQVGGSLKTQAAGFGSVARQGVRANSVAIEFNRIIQDAPFGLIGIGNNLQQLAGNFSNVRQQAGSTGKAVKASLASIISPINLGVLALSALTAGFTAYQMGAFDGLFATKDFREELEKFRESLDAVDSVRLDSLKSADEEIVKINALRTVIEDETGSRESRNKAVDELISKAPKIFSDLDREKILAGEVADAYEELTKQLVARAEVDSGVKRIVDLNDQERSILEQNKDKLDEINEVRQRIAEQQERAEKERLNFLNAETDIEKDLANRRRIGAENIIRFLRNENEVVDRLLNIDEDREKLKNIINESLEESVKLNEDEEKVVKKIVSATSKQLSLNQRLSNIYSDILDDLNEIEKSGLLKGKGGIIDFGVEVGDVPPVQERPSKTPERLVKLRQQELDLLERAGVEIKDMEFLSDKQILAYKAQADQLLKIDILSQQIGETLSSSFEDAILKGEDLFDSLEKGFKRLLAKLAAQLIASTILKVLGSIIGGPAGGILGSSLGSGVGSLLSGGGGGGSIGSNFSSLGAGIASVPSIPTPTSPTNIGSVASLSTMQVEVVGQISGSDIFLSNKRESEKRTRYYG